MPDNALIAAEPFFGRAVLAIVETSSRNRDLKANNATRKAFSSTDFMVNIYPEGKPKPPENRKRRRKTLSIRC